MRIEIELKKDVNPDVVANQLFKHTRLEDTFSINQVCLINGEPRQVSLKEMISAYIDHQREVIERRTKFDLKKIDDRLHILEGLLKALEDIDNVIAIIKSSPNTTTATNSLMTKYSLTQIQAKAIIDMKLRALTGLEKIELENENKELSEYSKGFNTQSITERDTSFFYEDLTKLKLDLESILKQSKLDKEQEIVKQIEEDKQSKLENLDKSFNVLQNKLDTYFKQ